MATKVYVTTPQLTTPGLPDELLLCYTIHVCEDGQLAVMHPPCSEETFVTVAFGESVVVIRGKIIDKILANIPNVTSNDIIFVPEIGT